MKRIMLDVPVMTNVITITYIYNDEKTYKLMAGTAIITNVDNPLVMNGEESYIVRLSDRSPSKLTPSDDGPRQGPKQG